MRHLRLVQVGIGTVGAEVLAQVRANHDHWRARLGLDVAVGAIVGRDGALVAGDGRALGGDALDAAMEGRKSGDGLGAVAKGRGLELVPPEDAVERLATASSTILVDAAAGDETAALDARALALGAGVVLSNKAPLALPAADGRSAALWAASGPGGRLRYEATCGAGLPVFSTLRALLDTGDEVREVQGALSGTFGAIFSAVAAGEPFSAAVRDAMARGYTEPDPRDDLSGLDVARKALILARTLGHPADLTDVAVEGLVPPHLAADRGVDVPAFLARVGELDGPLAERAAAARAAGQTLKYVATVAPAGTNTGTLAVGLRAVPTSTVLGALQGPENIVSIRTARYDAYPLVVSGPGAGAAVTAAGVLADVLSLAAGLNAGTPAAP